MAITGHKTWREAMRYTQRREQKKLARQAIDKLEAATKVANARTEGQRGVGNLHADCAETDYSERTTRHLESDELLLSLFHRFDDH